jgi:hypothetical protein
MSKLIISQQTYCPLWFLDAYKFAIRTEEEVVRQEQASLGRNVDFSGSLTRLTDDR